MSQDHSTVSVCVCVSSERVPNSFAVKMGWKTKTTKTQTVRAVSFFFHFKGAGSYSAWKRKGSNWAPCYYVEWPHQTKTFMSDIRKALSYSRIRNLSVGHTVSRQSKKQTVKNTNRVDLSVTDWGCERRTSQHLMDQSIHFLLDCVSEGEETRS